MRSRVKAALNGVALKTVRAFARVMLCVYVRSHAHADVRVRVMVAPNETCQGCTVRLRLSADPLSKRFLLHVNEPSPVAIMSGLHMSPQCCVPNPNLHHVQHANMRKQVLDTSPAATGDGGFVRVSDSTVVFLEARPRPGANTRRVETKLSQKDLVLVGAAREAEEYVKVMTMVMLVMEY